ncbi:MAG: hypothetical protein CVU60_17140 [Deltaproteobacteria bacterium HGW-Deltaproteobacteria-18]|nr:MAG: hypothetical protein CVU60_17140 [Deltaproteobacteria bacterium HGW-Deltaproteobacteria-18]
MRWHISTYLLLLAAALCFPSDFAAMGTGDAPIHNQSEQTEQRQENADAATGEPARTELRQEIESPLPDSPLKTQEGARPNTNREMETAAVVPQKQTEDPGTLTEEPLKQAAEATAQDRESNVQTVAKAEQDRNPSTTTAPLPIWRQDTRTPAPTPSEPAPGAQTDSGNQPVRLFQSAAFRGNFNALPKWKRVLSKVKGQIQTLNSCTSAKACPPGATSWQRIIKQARGKERMEQLRMINAFFNKWPYRLDQDAYGVSDWWATPQEFLKISGDCEDYAIIKYFALRELGFSQDELRIVVLKDRIRGIGHAVLAVFTHGDAYILNNISDAIFTHGKYRHYLPQYSLNEEHRWSHIPVAN